MYCAGNTAIPINIPITVSYLCFYYFSSLLITTSSRHRRTTRMTMSLRISIPIRFNSSFYSQNSSSIQVWDACDSVSHLHSQPPRGCFDNCIFDPRHCGQVSSVKTLSLAGTCYGGCFVLPRTALRHSHLVAVPHLIGIQCFLNQIFSFRFAAHVCRYS